MTTPKTFTPKEMQSIASIAKRIAKTFTGVDAQELQQDLYCFILDEKYKTPKPENKPNSWQERKKTVNNWKQWLTLRAKNNNAVYNPLQEQMLRREAYRIVQRQLKEEREMNTYHITQEHVNAFIRLYHQELPGIFPKARTSTLETLILIAHNPDMTLTAAFKKTSKHQETYSAMTKQRASIIEHVKQLISLQDANTNPRNTGAHHE